MAEDAKVTLRMGPEELQMMDDYVAEHPEIGSRSNFIRAAIRAYAGSGEATVEEEGGIFVRFSEVQLGALRLMKEEGICLNEEEFVRNCVLRQIIPEETAKESAANAFKTAQLASKMK